MTLIQAHGGQLKNLLLPKNQSLKYLNNKCQQLYPLTLNHRQLCDLELLMNGAFSPLNGFITKQDYDSVIKTMRLRNGTIWPIPVTLDITEQQANVINIGDEISLLDQQGLMIAVLQIEDKWRPDKQYEAQQVYNTTDRYHPNVKYLCEQAGSVYLGGKILGIQSPQHYDFTHLRHTPQQLRDYFTQHKWINIVAFQTRNPIHRAHYEITLRAAKTLHANLLIHPVVGDTKVGDVDPFTRVRCYQHIMPHYPEGLAKLSLLQLAMRMAGAKEAVWHAIIRKNYGCNNIIIGRDHAGIGKDKNNQDFYPPYAAQKLVAQFAKELQIHMLPFQEVVYVNDLATYMPINEVSRDQKTLKMSGTTVREYLQKGRDIPAWVSYPEVIKELQYVYPPLHQQGFTVLLTGLPAAGKSTIAQALQTKLLAIGRRNITLLDGDVIRNYLSPELGFNKTDRDLNILRVGYIAKQINFHKGITICAFIAPYRETRDKVRKMIAAVGGFIEVYVATPLEICIKRDYKGLYKKAMDGTIANVTGISDPYETPLNPEVIINTAECSIEHATEQIISAIKKLGYISDNY